ncbi:MAG: hypothetical protein ACPGO3_00470 [Magnetospiraceae bacterium]
MASGDLIVRFGPKDADPPTASFATFDLRNARPVIDFAIGESVHFADVLGDWYAGGGLTVTVHFAMSAAISNSIRLEAAFERIGVGVQDLDADGFAAAKNSGDVVVPGTSGLIGTAVITFANGAEIDSLVAGESFRLILTRIAAGGTDATGDLELHRIDIEET